MDKWECISGGDPAPSSFISCEGATNSFKFVLAIRDGTEPPPDAMYVVVDGVEVSDNSAPLPWYQHSVLNENYPFPVPAGFSVGQGVAQARNLDSVSHRLEFKSKSDDLLIFMYDNPTVVELDTAHKHVGTCLSALSATSQISCEGAGDSVFFFDAVLPETNPPEGTTYFKVDGVIIGDLDPFPEWLEIQFLYDQQPDPSEIPDGFIADGENGNLRRWVNNDVVPHRIEMGSNDSTLVREIMYGNESVIEMTDIKGEHSGVCLSPKQSDISNFEAVYDNVNGNVVISGKTLLPNQSVLINIVLVDFVDDKITISSDANGNFNLRVQTFKSSGIYHVYANVLDSDEKHTAQIDVKSTADYLVPPTLSVTGVKSFNANPNGENHVKMDIYYSNGMPFNTLNIYNIAQFWTTLDGFSNGDFTLPGNSGQKLCIAAVKLFPQQSDPTLVDILEYIVP